MQWFSRGFWLGVAAPGAMLACVLGGSALGGWALAGCDKKKDDPPPVMPSPPPPAPTPPPVAELAPLLELDSGAPDAAADAATAVRRGPGTTVNQNRFRQCCSALRTTAKNLGSSPEANNLLQAATMCEAISAQLNPNTPGRAPEFAGVVALLKGVTLPAVCQGL
jgi:hypothetical protein